MTDRPKATLRIERGYKAILSTKHEICIDPDEIQDVIKAVADGNLIQVRQGLINPSYLAAIVEDVKRRVDFREDHKHDPARLNAGMLPLKDIFEERPLALPSG